MSKVIYTKEFTESPLHIEQIDSGVKIEIGTELILINDHHESDCCEHVYADWPTLEAYKKQLGSTYNKVELKGLEQDGFLIVFKGTWGKEDKVFIPCYNEQNGYYSSDLHLIITDGEQATKVDISDYVTDNID
jgi:hypothetical protein